MNYRVLWQRVGPFFTGLVIGALAWTPAFALAATASRLPSLPDRWQPYVLIGSLILLAIALGLKAIGKTRPVHREVIDPPTDLRERHRIDAIDVPLLHQ